MKLSNLKPGQECEGRIYVGILFGDKNQQYALLVEKEDRCEMGWHEAKKTKALPSFDELTLMKEYRKILNMSGVYWSSTDYTGKHALVRRFGDDGSWGYDYNREHHKVRCIKRVPLELIES